MHATLDDLARALDRVLLLEDIGLEPDGWQAEVLRAEDDRILILAGRQMGKSSTVAALALHTALYRAGSDTLILSPAERQSNELLRKIVSFYDILGRPLGALADAATTLELGNRARVLALPGSERTIRSFSAPALIVVDEAARVPDEVIGALSPMLATGGGRMIQLSTPFGRRGAFFRAWDGDAGRWRRFMVTADRCPRITREFLADERVRLGPLWYAQEYECVFNEAIGQLFSTASVLRAFDAGGGEALFGGGSEEGLYVDELCHRVGSRPEPRPVGAGDPQAGAGWPEWRPAAG